MSNSRKRKFPAMESQDITPNTAPGASLENHDSLKVDASDAMETVRRDPRQKTHKMTAPAARKVFTYSRNCEESWSFITPPDFTHECWDDPKLQALKVELNRVKGLLSDIDIGKWQCHTGSTQLGGAIQRHVQKYAQAELCTQAWCKFYEILSQFDVVHATKTGNLKSVHLCEGPGAFVSSLNHFLKSRGFYTTWEWLALSLNPYYEGNKPGSTIMDDTLIRDTRPNWFFGEDNSGDLMKVENLLSLVDRTGKWTADLVTADGSINCSDRPAQQEEVVAALHLAEVVGALHIIATRGSFVIKMFTLFESCTVSLLYLLNFLFTDVFVFKPTASKPGNSEVYVICEDFRGIELDLLNKLTNLVAKNRPFVIPKEQIPLSFLQCHIDCCTYFTQLQIQTIQLNLDLYNRGSRDWLEGVMAMRMVCAKKYIEENEIKPINRHQKLIRHRESEVYSPTSFRFVLYGSYNQRIEEAAMSWRDKMAAAKPYEITPEEVIWLTTPDIIKPLNGYCMKLTIGVSPQRILSSRYCQQDVLDNYNDMLDNAQYLKSVKEPSDFEGVFRNLLRLLNLTECQVHCLALNEKSEFIDYCLSRATNLANQRLLLADVTINHQTELKSKMFLYDTLIEALKVLKRGDVFVCRLHSALSRWTVSIIYLLKTLSQSLTINSLGDNVNCYLVCVGFNGVNNCLLGRLIRARQHGERLLQIIPVDWMEYSVFRRKITDMNHHILLKRLNDMIVKERQFLNLE